MFHHRNQGWTVADHLAAFQLDALHDLYWAKTVDGQKGINRPERTPRPTTAEPEVAEDDGNEFRVTVGDYVRMVAEAQEREQQEAGG